MTTYTQIGPMPRRAAPRRRLAVAIAIAARARARGRGGITLMEVLISIGIILMGLAGVSALLPVGRYQIAEAAKRDRSAACGRAVLRDLQVRGLIDPKVWVYPNGNSVTPIPANGAFPTILDAPLMIDPIGIASGSSSVFNRLTFPACWNSLPLANLLCTWRDELEFDIPEDASVRPKRMFRMTNGDASTDVSVAGNLVTGESADNYSWLLSVSPSDAEIELPGNPDLRTFNRRKFQVAVVVFYKRDVGNETVLTVANSDFTTPVAPARLSLGGGDVALRGSVVGDLRPGEWIVVRGQKQGFSCAKWYRVLAAPEPIGTDRRVTLAGPDWDVSYTISDAVYLPGVVGVYTENVEVQR